MDLFNDWTMNESEIFSLVDLLSPTIPSDPTPRAWQWSDHPTTTEVGRASRGQEQGKLIKNFLRAILRWIQMAEACQTTITSLRKPVTSIVLGARKWPLHLIVMTMSWRYRIRGTI